MILAQAAGAARRRPRAAIWAIRRRAPGGPPGAAAGPAGAAPVGQQIGAKPRPFIFSIAVKEGWTNNVNLTPSASAKSDFVTSLTPALAIDEKGASTSLKGLISAPTSLYVRTGAENNKIYPEVDLLGNAELLERFLFLEGDVSVSAAVLHTLRGPAGGLGERDRRTATPRHRTAITPYIKGITPGGIQYELRNNNTWTSLSSTPISANSAYYDQWVGTDRGPDCPIRMGARLRLEQRQVQ